MSTSYETALLILRDFDGHKLDSEDISQDTPWCCLAEEIADVIDRAPNAGRREGEIAMRERAAAWHDEQHGAWLDQARNAQRLSQSGDEADRQMYRAQHEAYAAYAIIHRQAAGAIRALEPS